MEQRAISTPKANPPIGPYNQAVAWNNLVFTASVPPRNPTYGVAPEGDARAAARNSLENLKAILEEAGSGLDYVLKVTLYINDMADFPAINEVYATYFTGIRPARSLVRVGGPPGTCSFDAIAYIPS
jgi:2-iminobutanoate/2-iminopropanoate deaminase